MPSANLHLLGWLFDKLASACGHAALIALAAAPAARLAGETLHVGTLLELAPALAAITLVCATVALVCWIIAELLAHGLGLHDVDRPNDGIR